MKKKFKFRKKACVCAWCRACKNFASCERGNTFVYCRISCASCDGRNNPDFICLGFTSEKEILK